MDEFDDYNSRGSGSDREFYVRVETYISNKAAAGLRKPASNRKRGDKRESLRPAYTSGDDPQKKLKERSSWLTLNRAPTAGGSWRPATCRLAEGDEGCLLTVYIEETILYHNIYVHTLKHTDIRHADRSLFLRKDCIGIHCTNEQRWSATPSTEPLYVHFANTDTTNSWIALLRSYAQPEVYGPRANPREGGLYRMWRQVDVSIVQGRNITPSSSSMGWAAATSTSIKQPFASSSSEGFSLSGVIASTAEAQLEPDTSDMDVYCEIYMYDIVCGRTTTKRGLGAPDWHEGFTFSDLPQFDTMEIMVWREKKMLKPILLGSVSISLRNFRRGEAVEAWYPVLLGEMGTSAMQLGELRLRLRVDEEIILPLKAYGGLLITMTSRNSLDWISDLESKLQLQAVSSQLLSISVARNVLLENLYELADREVDGTSNSHNTLFRGNTVLTKTMEMAMAWYGKGFLEASVGSVIRRLYAEKVAIEVDPARCAGKSPKEIEKNVEQLVYWCQEFWDQIYETRGECPQEMRKLFYHVRQLVEKRYQVKDLPQDKKKELPWQSVSAFCFLRFFVPAILHPHLFGLCHGLPDTPVQRSLTLIAKVIQSLANLNATVQREEFMRGVKDFLTGSLHAMIDYILVVSTPGDGKSYSSSGQDKHAYERLNVMNSIRQRGHDLPLLHKEAIPTLPHLLDIPRHLAVVSSAVIRQSTGYARSRLKDTMDPILNEFCARCFDIEEQALERVSQLAVPAMPTNQGWVTKGYVEARLQSLPRTRKISHPQSAGKPKRAVKRSSRPSTAASTADGSDVSRLRDTATHSDVSTPSSPPPSAPSTLQQCPQSGSLAADASSIPSEGTRRRPRLSLSRPQSLYTEEGQSFGMRSKESFEFEVQSMPTSPIEPSDDVSRRKRGLLRGILARH